jgi:hypothetical protein
MSLSGANKMLCAAVAFGAALALGGCGSSHDRFKVTHGVIHIPRGYETDSLVRGVDGVTLGSPASEVTKTFGMPLTRAKTRFRARPDSCWNYRAEQPDTPIDGLSFCIQDGKVERIMTAVHA